jgi:hypothetical protein
MLYMVRCRSPLLPRFNDIPLVQHAKMQQPVGLVVEHLTLVFALVPRIFNAAREEGPLRLALALFNQLTRCSQVWPIYFEVLV